MLGVWRSLVARSVRVGEVPSSNLGTPTWAWGNPGSPTSPLLASDRVVQAAEEPPARILLPMALPSAVVSGAEQSPAPRRALS
jgi:hypothetical protein